MPSKHKLLTLNQLRERVDLAFSAKTGKENHPKIGLELEIWPFRRNVDCQRGLIPYFNEEGSGLIQLLQQFAETRADLAWTPLEDGTPMFTYNCGAKLTFEPGGQLEYSSPPYASISGVIGAMSTHIEDVRCFLKSHGIWLFHSGLNPWHQVSDVPMMLQKPRYIAMDAYFQNLGPFGQQMMRLSTSLQVNLDGGDADTLQRRWLAANLVAPFICAIFGNSPFAKGTYAGARSFRSIIWQNLDPSRTGFPRFLIMDEFKPCPVAQYFEFALDAFCMRLPDERGQLTYLGKYRSFRYWLEQGINGYYPTLEDWDVHLTTLFPEVRAKGFFEVRCMDAQSRAWCYVPGILFTHILYSSSVREKVIDLLMPYRTTLKGLLREAALHGMSQPDIAETARKVFSMVLDDFQSLDKDEVYAIAERFFKRYTAKNINPADELLALNDGQIFSVDQYLSLEKEQLESVSDLIGLIKQRC